MAHTIRLLVLEGLTPEHLLTLYRGGFFSSAFDAPATTAVPALPEGVTGQVARVSVPDAAPASAPEKAKAPAVPADPPPPAPTKASKTKPAAPVAEPEPAPQAPKAASKFAEETDDDEPADDEDIPPELADKLAGAKKLSEIVEAFLDAGIGAVDDGATDAEAREADAKLVEAVRNLRESGHPVLSRIAADQLEDRVLRTLAAVTG